MLCAPCEWSTHVNWLSHIVLPRVQKKQWSGCLCFWISRQCGLVLPLIDHSVNSGSVGAILSYLRRDGILAMPTCMPPSCAGYLYCSAYSLHSSSQRILSALRRNRRRISSTFFVLWCSDWPWCNDAAIWPLLNRPPGSFCESQVEEALWTLVTRILCNDFLHLILGWLCMSSSNRMQSVCASLDLPDITIVNILAVMSVDLSVQLILERLLAIS